jgi:hypothetical protein
MGMTGSEPNNHQVTVILQRRLSRLTIFFYASLVAIPLGLLCPCCLAALVYRVAPGYSQPIALSAFFLPLVGLSGALLVRGDRSRTRRTLELARLASDLGLCFTPQPALAQIEFATSFPVLNLLRTPQSGQGANLLEGPYKGRHLAAMDYTFLGLLGYKHFVAKQTVAVFLQGFEDVPSFAILPQTWADRFEQFLLGTSPGKMLRIPGEKEFNQHFVVVGTEPDVILARIGTGLIDLFLEDRQLALEVKDGRLLVYRRNQVLTAKAYEDFLRQVHRVAKELERGRGKG